MQQVAQDVIDRLSAEFHKDDLYAAYRFFDLDTWAVLRRSPESDVWSTLIGAGHKMCGALGVVIDEYSWKRAAREPLRVRVQMLRGPADKRVDNRAAWRAVAKCPSWCIRRVFLLVNVGRQRGSGARLEHRRRHSETTCGWFANFLLRRRGLLFALGAEPGGPRSRGGYVHARGWHAFVHSSRA